jgi:hypothetical protein
MSPTLINLLDSWVREAVARHGDNWAAIMAAVEENIESLEDPQRTELSQQMTLIFASGSVVAGPNPN